MNTAANIINFPFELTQAGREAEAAKTAEQPAKRKPFEWVTPAELRGILKEKLGLNARKVSVSSSRGCGNQYLTVTVRDAAVDIAAVSRAVSEFNTWHMDMTDYVTGQSISVKTTAEVDEAHAAPFIPAIKALLPRLAEIKGCEILEVMPGVLLDYENGGNAYVRDGKGERGQNVYAWDLVNGKDYAIEALAKHIHQILNKAA